MNLTNVFSEIITEIYKWKEWKEKWKYLSLLLSDILEKVKYRE